MRRGGGGMSGHYGSLGAARNVNQHATVKTTHISLLGTAAALLVVGLVSGTLIRHLVQVAPLVLVLIAARRWKPAVGAWAAVSVLSFWMVVMVLIWLFLLGLSRVTEGDFTVIEVALTVVIGAFSAAGIVSGIRAGRSLAWWQKVLTILAGWLVQAAVMAVSLSEPVARR